MHGAVGQSVPPASVLVRILAATDLSSGSSTVKRLAIRLRVTGPRR